MEHPAGREFEISRITTKISTACAAAAHRPATPATPASRASNAEIERLKEDIRRVQLALDVQADATCTSAGSGTAGCGTIYIYFEYDASVATCSGVF